MVYFESILKVLAVGLILVRPARTVRHRDAGLLVRVGGEEADHVIHKPNPALKYLGVVLFLFVSFVIIVAVAWITRATIIHHFGVDLFPTLKK